MKSCKFISKKYSVNRIAEFLNANLQTPVYTSITCAVYFGIACSRRWKTNSSVPAHPSKTDSDINTKAGGEEDTLTIRVRNDKIVEKNLFVHFPISAKRFWDNVVYTCSNMLAFKSEKDIDEWCMKHRIKKGEVISLEQVWELAKLWYGNYLDPDWKRKTPEIAEEIFRKAGLTSDFWKMK